MRESIWLGKKSASQREFAVSNNILSRRRDDLDGRPSAFDGLGELEAVHRRWNVDIGENVDNVAPGLKYKDRLVGVCRLDDYETGFFDHVDRSLADEGFIFDDQKHLAFSPRVPRTEPRSAGLSNLQRILAVTGPHSLSSVESKPPAGRFIPCRVGRRRPPKNWQIGRYVAWESNGTSS